MNLPTKIIAEIGQNHNGDLDTALQLMEAAKEAGCDFVKFQKREPSLAVPLEQQSKLRQTPWGEMTYLDYRKRLEFGVTEYDVINNYSNVLGIPWLASAWDIPSVDFLIAKYNVEYIKIPSAKATDIELIKYIHGYLSAEIILSTGMCTWEDIDKAVAAGSPSVIMHCTSTYPCPMEELNLHCIPKLAHRYIKNGNEEYAYNREIGYSGHEVGLATTLAAVALGATWVERHITLDRSMWGTDQAASVEPSGFKRLVKDIRNIESSLGDGFKKVEPGEVEPMKRLRGFSHNPVVL
tara:strand:- start:204 stop:1085 length:882 start_codon:yes stop_codon:yes gene_type:complete